MKKKKSRNRSAMRCPYCGAPVLFRSAEGIYRENLAGTMLYVCANYPQCDAYVRVHPGTDKPVGTLANRTLRVLRREAHSYIDRICAEGIMKKQEVYYWIAALIGAPLSEAHIGLLGNYYCAQIIEECKKLLAKKRRTR